jgi:hypothetical protein
MVLESELVVPLWEAEEEKLSDFELGHSEKQGQHLVQQEVYE